MKLTKQDIWKDEKRKNETRKHEIRKQKIEGNRRIGRKIKEKTKLRRNMKEIMIIGRKIELGEQKKDRKKDQNQKKDRKNEENKKSDRRKDEKKEKRQK